MVLKSLCPWQQLESKLLPSLIALFILQYKNAYSRKEKVKSSSLEMSSTQPGTFDQESQHKLFKVFPVSFCWVITNGWFAISSFTWEPHLGRHSALSRTLHWELQLAASVEASQWISVRCLQALVWCYLPFALLIGLLQTLLMDAVRAHDVLHLLLPGYCFTFVCYIFKNSVIPNQKQSY